MKILAFSTLFLAPLWVSTTHAADTARLKLDTALGPIIVEVDLKHAPVSAAEFLRYVLLAASVPIKSASRL
jgi:hypothetical protein